MLVVPHYAVAFPSDLSPHKAAGVFARRNIKVGEVVWRLGPLDQVWTFDDLVRQDEVAFDLLLLQGGIRSTYTRNWLILGDASKFLERSAWNGKAANLMADCDTLVASRNIAKSQPLVVPPEWDAMLDWRRRVVKPTLSGYLKYLARFEPSLLSDLQVVS